MRDGMVPAAFSGLSDGVLTSFAGNGMHVGCLGVTIAWILGHLAPPELSATHNVAPQARHLSLAVASVAAKPALPLELLQGLRQTPAASSAADEQPLDG